MSHLFRIQQLFTLAVIQLLSTLYPARHRVSPLITPGLVKSCKVWHLKFNDHVTMIVIKISVKFMHVVAIYSCFSGSVVSTPTVQLALKG